jgi:hypothetical protein
VELLAEDIFPVVHLLETIDRIGMIRLKLSSFLQACGLGRENARQDGKFTISVLTIDSLARYAGNLLGRECDGFSSGY